MMNKKRRFLGKLIADLQNSSNNNQNGPLAQEPKLQKKRLIPVPLYYNIQPLYEFFLIGEINLELQLDNEEEYFPIGVKQSPLNKWRPFVKAEQFHNRIEMTIDASYQGISEFDFITQKLQCCSSDMFKQLALYLHGYQHFVRRIKEKMLNNPVPPRLYEYKFQNFIKKSTEYVNNLPIDGLYAVSILQLDYTIYNTKRIKFIVSKALAEIIGGVDQHEAAQILLRKGWMEVFGGAQRIMKNIMLLNRLMKEGRQLLTFKIYTVDKILIQVQAEIEIVQCLRTFVDVGFVEIIKFTISQETRSYLHEVRNSNNQLKSLPYELYFNDKTFDPLPPSTPVTYQTYNKDNITSNQSTQFEQNLKINQQNEIPQQQQTQLQGSQIQVVNSNISIQQTESINQNLQKIESTAETFNYEIQENKEIPINDNISTSTVGLNNEQPQSHRSSLDDEIGMRQGNAIKKEEQEIVQGGSRNRRKNGSTSSKRSRSNSSSNQTIPGAMSIQEIEQQADLITNQQLKKLSEENCQSDKNRNDEYLKISSNRHPNYDKHILDEQYEQKSKTFIEKFYTEQEILKIKLAQQSIQKKQTFPNIQQTENYGQEYNTNDKNDNYSRTDSFDMRGKTSSLSDKIQMATLSLKNQNSSDIIKFQDDSNHHLQNQPSNLNLQNQIPNEYQKQYDNFKYNQYHNQQNRYIRERNSVDYNSFSTSNYNQISTYYQNNHIKDNINLSIHPQKYNNQFEKQSSDQPESKKPEIYYSGKQWINHNRQNNSFYPINYYETYFKSDQTQQSLNPYCKEQNQQYSQEQIQNKDQNSKDQQLLLTTNDQFQIYSQTQNQYENSQVINMDKSHGSNLGIDEYINKQEDQQSEKQQNDQQYQKDEYNDDFELNQHKEYFNIFEDESLGFTVQDLNQQQIKLQKMIYHEYQNQNF